MDEHNKCNLDYAIINHLNLIRSKMNAEFFAFKNRNNNLDNTYVKTGTILNHYNKWIDLYKRCDDLDTLFQLSDLSNLDTVFVAEIDKIEQLIIEIEKNELPLSEEDKNELILIQDKIENEYDTTHKIIVN